MVTDVIKILLAEDDKDDQNLFFEFLQHRNDLHLMPSAGDGMVVEEILNEILQDADLPHLIILDQNMPKRNGLLTLQFLKENRRFKHIPVVIYSTYTDNILIEKGAEMGAVAVVAKPISKQGYEDMINNITRQLS